MASQRKLVNRQQAFGYFAAFSAGSAAFLWYYGYNTAQEKIILAVLAYGVMFMGFKTIFPDIKSGNTYRA